MRVIEYNDSNIILAVLTDLIKAKAIVVPKDDPFTLRLGFVENDTWHKIPLRLVKGRKDIADKLKELMDAK